MFRVTILHFFVSAERMGALEAGLLTVEVMVRENSSKLDIALMNIGRLQRTLAPKEKRITKPHGMPKLPLETKDDLKKFEAFLKSSDDNLSAVVSVIDYQLHLTVPVYLLEMMIALLFLLQCDYMSVFVKTMVPDPERKTAQNILTNLMYNNLAKLMNLEGGNSKIGFRGLYLYKVFQGTFN